MKHEKFSKELETIKNDDIRKFAEVVLDDAPDYFFHVAASSTGKYHPSYALGDGGLMRHTKAVVRMYNHLLSLEQYQCLFTEREIDLGRVACIAHDIQKSGDEETYIARSNGGQNKVFTVFDHPLLASQYIMQYKGQYLTEEELNFITLGVESHMGQWNTDRRSSIVLSKPQTAMQKLIHLADYLASRKDLDVSFADDEVAHETPSPEEYVIGFGKWAGTKLTEIPKDYLQWLARQDLKEPLKTLIPMVLQTN